jgi:hypothetical protein
MKIHICSTEVMKKHQPNFKTGHYLDLPDERVISIGEIADVHEEPFVADGAIALPHMLDIQPIGSEVAQALSHLGIKPEHKTFEVLLAVGKIHPSFRPSAF